MGCSCSRFSVISFWGTYIRHTFTAAGLSSQAIHVDDETTIHFWGPKSPDPTNPKPPLVLLHGFGPDTHWQWHPQVAFFAREFALYIPNLVFFGDSTTKSAERSEMFQAVSVGKLMEKLGVKRYYVVGTSYGGYVAYHMAAMWPERVEKVVIASSAVNWKQRDNVEFLEKRAKAGSRDELLLPETAAQLRALLATMIHRGRHGYMPDFLLNDVILNMYSKNRKMKIELLEGLHVGKHDTINISPLRQDVFLVWGEHDQLFPLEKATELMELLGEKTKLEVIKNTGHAPQIEKPAQFNKIVYKLLVGSSSPPHDCNTGKKLQ
ncbi:hypothetical protein RHGRI_001919 [Rhododendron griersonianum]|uniref:AB hydrolase-1 domain-containing protein n=1 Tax=Rhododendron griersonianum TaxID=479676 RepID=A0AAV6LP56_9ERIC|nr:hypothetical protein RHGRI_001919 [Rhododendron griersonianum]